MTIGFVRSVATEIHGAPVPKDLPQKRPEPPSLLKRKSPNDAPEDANKIAGEERDLARGEGGTFEVPVKPGNTAKDD